MKKFVVCLIMFSVIPAICADDTAFYEALKTCSPYSSYGDVSAEGMDVQVKSSIKGWEDGKCVFQEKSAMKGIDSVVTCRFTKPQTEELVNVMRAYSILNAYDGNSVDTSSLDAVKNNPIVKVWNKYLQDSSVCQIEIKQ
jgi:hypothetical protein